MHASIAESTDSSNSLPFRFNHPLSSIHIWLTLTNLCNINCKYCFNYVANNHEHMSPDMATGILRKHIQYQLAQGNPNPLLHVLFFGGEPTINDKALLTLIDYLDQQEHVSFVPHLLTNGIIKPALLEKLIDKYVFFQISFDGFKGNLRLARDEKTDINRITVNTIKKVVGADVPLLLRGTFHAANVHYMQDLVEFAAGEGVKKVSMCYLFPDGNAEKYKINPPIVETYVENFIKAYERGKQLGVKVISGEVSIYERTQKEDSLPERPAVWLPDGSLSTTIAYASSRSASAKDFIVGKYHLEADRFTLDPTRIKTMKQAFLANRSLNCQDCSVLSVCQGSSRTDCYFINRPLTLLESYRCAVTAKLIHYFQKEN